MTQTILMNHKKHDTNKITLTKTKFIGLTVTKSITSHDHFLPASKRSDKQQSNLRARAEESKHFYGLSRPVLVLPIDARILQFYKVSLYSLTVGIFC
jgi:hypothetical protein